MGARKPQRGDAKGARRHRPGAPPGGDAALNGQGRAVLALVALFTLAFVVVIGVKIAQEWRGERALAAHSQGRDAAFVAERVGGLIGRAADSVASAAGALDADWSPDGAADIFGHLKALQNRPDILHAAVIGEDGRPSGATDPAAAKRLAAALTQRPQGARAWLHRDPENVSRLIAVAPLRLGSRSVRLAAELEVEALAGRPPIGQAVTVVGFDGEVLTARADGVEGPPSGLSVGETFGLSDDLARAARDAINTGAQGFRFDNGAPAALGVAPVRVSGAPGERVMDTGLSVYVVGPLRIDEAAWRRKLMFYALLLVSPLFVAAGLCAVLLMQLGNIRQAREALFDSERRFRLAVEGARCGVVDWDVSTDQVYMTASLARMLGRDAAATMSGSAFLSLVRKEDHANVRSAVRGAASTGEFDVEFRAAALPVWLHARGRPWIDHAGRASGRVVGVAIDVTERKGAQARVAAAENRLRAALESMSESFVLWDARRRLVLSNRKFRDFFHLDDKLVKPGAAYEMLELAAQGAIKEVYEGSDDDASEMELADGRWIHLSERRTGDGGLVSIGTDITPLKRQEAQLIENEKRLRKTVSDLKRAQERLGDLARENEREKIRAEEANRSKSEFLANMSHELRTPLNAINGFSEIMLEEMFGELGDARYKEYVGDILASGQHLLSLINDILDMSKIEAGKMTIAPEPVFPDEIVEQCARLMRGRAKEADLALDVEMGELPEIQADPRAIKQVCLNLLSNAIKFTPEGGTVTLRAFEEGDGVTFEVVDTGIGIAKDDLNRIGQPFEQIESQHSKKHKGTGLGLALSRSLAEMHGGWIRMESELGVGTTASFHVPRKAAPAADALIDQGPQAA